MRLNILPVKSLNIAKDSRENILLENGNQTVNGCGGKILQWCGNVLDVARSFIMKAPIGRLKTKDLDRAAFFITLGATLVELQEKYPENVFVIDVPLWMFSYEKYQLPIKYRKFCEARRKLKKKGRKEAGLPEHFTGENNGTYKMNDIAVIRRFTKTELQKME
jgi:hypothetical protein